MTSLAVFYEDWPYFLLKKIRLFRHKRLAEKRTEESQSRDCDQDSRAESHVSAMPRARAAPKTASYSECIVLYVAYAIMRAQQSNYAGRVPSLGKLSEPVIVFSAMEPSQE